MLGYVHGDLKFQNICYDHEREGYSLIDFALVSKVFHKSGTHRIQEEVHHFYGNSMFASDAMINLKTTSRKDDLESLLYIMCYLYNGTLPVIEFINNKIDTFHMSKFLAAVLEFRRNN